MIDQPDERVAEAARRGSHEAFSVLVARYGRRVYSLCLRMTGHRSDAEDLVQDVFLRAYRAVGRYQPSRRFAPWLMTIAANACRNHVRNRGAASRGEDWLRDEARDAVSAPPSDAALLSSEDSGAVRAALATLSPGDRISLLLRYEEGLTLEETADALGIPRARAAVRIFRAKARLREALAESTSSSSSAPDGQRTPEFRHNGT